MPPQASFGAGHFGVFLVIALVLASRFHRMKTERTEWRVALLDAERNGGFSFSDFQTYRYPCSQARSFERGRLKFSPAVAGAIEPHFGNLSFAGA